jgi:hypothetical protein
MTRLWIIYPENRWVSANQIDSWYSDARADGRLSDDGTATDPYDQALVLQDIGDITLGR